MADPLWRDLLKYSNEGKYGEFVQKFAKSLARGTPKRMKIATTVLEDKVRELV